jgi:hypothetical protein
MTFYIYIAPQSPSSIIWGLYNRPEVAAVHSGLSPTPLKKSMDKIFPLTSTLKIYPVRDDDVNHKKTIRLQRRSLCFFISLKMYARANLSPPHTHTYIYIYINLKL